MASQFYGKTTALNPHITIGAFTAAAAVQFNTEPFAPSAPPLIVSGVIHSVTGTTTKTITFARAPQQFSYTDSFGDEIQYTAIMGGNVCQTGENERGYSWVNPRSFRGSDALDRCEPGDLAKANNRGFLVTSATPFAAAPTSTQWSGSEAQATVWFWEATVNDLRLPAPFHPVNPAAVNVFDTGTGMWGGAKLEIDNSGWEDCERVIFNRPSDSAADPFWYPPAAQFSTSPTAAEYWFDPIGQRFRLASHNESRGDEYRATWWVRGLEQWEGLSTSEVWGVENTDNAAGFANSESPDNEDAVVMLATRIGGTFDRTFRVYRVNGVFPRLSLMWRTDAEVDSACLSVDINGTTYAGAMVRATGGNGNYNPATPGPGFPPVMAGQYYDIRVVLTGSVVQFFQTDEGGSEEGLFGTSITGQIPASPSGWVGIAVWGNAGARFSGFLAGEDVELIRVGAEGRAGLRIDGYSPASYQSVAYSLTRDRKTAEALQSLTNLTADITMTDSATKRRDTYDFTSPAITVWSEASGDLIRVQEAAPGSAPGGVGRGPQVPNTVNFYDPSDDATAKNRANWRDQIQIHDPWEEFNAIAGETVSIYRSAVFDSNNPPALSYSFRDNASAGWTPMTAGTDYIMRAAEGLVLLSAAFIAGLGGDAEQLCIRAEGVRILHNGSQTARQFNDMAAALDAFDGLFCNVTPTGTGEIRIRASSVIGNGPSSYECHDTTCWRPDGWAWGLPASSMPEDYADFPYWSSGIKSYVTASFDRLPTPLDCNSTPQDPADWIVPNLILYEIEPNANAPGTGKAMQWGSTLDFNFFPPSLLMLVSFNIGGPLYSWPDVIARLPEGAVCEEAFLTARFSGLTVQRQTAYYETQTLVPDSPIVNSSSTSNLTTADLAFGALAIRRDSVQVLDLAGNPATVIDYDFKALGTSLTAEFTDEEWRRVDVTTLVNGLIAERDSEFTDWCLWPAVAPFGAGTDALGAYLLSMAGEYSAGIVAVDGCDVDYFISATAKYAQADSFEVGAILARFRLPDGSLTPVLPIIATPFMPEP
jgi:hypothetical protein